MCTHLGKSFYHIRNHIQFCDNHFSIDKTYTHKKIHFVKTILAYAVHTQIIT